MLLGREAELARTEALVATARDGGSGALVIVGEPGIGKSALLEQTRERADGIGVLSARGFEAERELAFAGLSLLLRPMLDRLDEVPEPQRRALEIALGVEEPAEVDRFAAYAGTLSLLSAAAAERPLLVCVDDAHWLDLASAEALVFTARRLGREGIAMLLAAREGDGSSFESGDLPQLRLIGLGPEPVEQLLGERAESPVSARVAHQVHDATKGNPLAVVELSGRLNAEQLAGHEPLGEPPPTGANVARAFGQRIEELPADSRRALVVISADPTVSPEVLSRALQTLGLGAQLLEPAEQAGLLHATAGRLEFRHPLVRSAAYHGAPGPERRAATGPSPRPSKGAATARGGPGTWPPQRLNPTRRSPGSWRQLDVRRRRVALPPPRRGHLRQRPGLRPPARPRAGAASRPPRTSTSPVRRSRRGACSPRSSLA